MRLEGIDTLRGLAVLAVVIYHYFVLFGLQASPWFSYIHTYGLFGVSLFFVISGFLIYRSVATRIERHGLKEGLRRYAIHRFFRIVPAYYVNLFFVILLTASFLLGWDYLLSGAFVKPLFYHLTFSAYFVYKDAGFGINGAYWTLNIEMLWYLLAPLLFLYAKTLPRLLLLGALALLYFFALQKGWLDPLLHTDSDDPAWMLKRFFLSFQLPGQILFFVAGILIYRYRERLTLPLPAWTLYTLFFAVPALFSYVNARWQIIPLFFWNNLQLLLVTATLFILFYRRALKLLHPLAWLGEISYSVYLWHMPLLFLFKQTALPLLTKTVLFTLTLLLVSLASYYFVERWGFKAQKRFEKN